jgi:hypothetical protein
MNCHLLPACVRTAQRDENDVAAATLSLCLLLVAKAPLAATALSTSAARGSAAAAAAAVTAAVYGGAGGGLPITLGVRGRACVTSYIRMGRMRA